MSRRQKAPRHDHDCARDHEVLIDSPRNACDCGLADLETQLAQSRKAARELANAYWLDIRSKELRDLARAVLEEGEADQDDDDIVDALFANAPRKAGRRQLERDEKGE